MYLVVNLEFYQVNLLITTGVDTIEYLLNVALREIISDGFQEKNDLVV